MQSTPYFDVLAGGGWPEALRAQLLELNAQVVESVVAMRATGLAPLWRALTPEARVRAADCPYLLIDLGLAGAGPWPAAASPGVADSPALPPLEAPLLRRALLLAWHSACTHGPTARVAFGMSAQAAASLAARPLTDLDRLADQRPGWMRPRWLDHPAYWRSWLLACAQARQAEIERLRFWGLQRLAAEVMPRPAVAPAPPAAGVPGPATLKLR